MKVRCKICGKIIEAVNKKQAKTLLAQHLLTHNQFAEKLIKLAREKHEV
jgi:hypothetical protein